MKFVRTFMKESLWQSGGYRLVASVRPWQGVAVLNYHGIRDALQTALATSEELHVRASVFESHLQVIRALGTPISLSDWRRARSTGRGLPSRAVLVTFDDGYRSVSDVALPLLERYDVPAAAFVCTGPSQSGHLLWYDALERLGRSAEIESAKQLPYDAWRRLVASHRVMASRDDARAVMTPDEIAALARSPLIEIGAHTVDHPMLARASEAVQRQQIFRFHGDADAMDG